jgi:hypothetical protein
MLTARNLPASAATLKRLTAITLDFAQAHHLSAREVQALLDAVATSCVCSVGEER